MEQLFELFYQTSGICTDTRKIKNDCLFICLSGANFNGNTFAKNALELGAKYVIVDDIGCADNKQIFYVENSLLFLQKLATNHRHKFKIPIIGITGSNGKTSTKELIFAVLSKKFNTLATTGNLNNHIGVPLTLLELNADHEIAIVEMGANKFKDIHELCEIAEPTHGIITNIGKAHLEGFLNYEGVLKTKKELYDALEKVDGTIFINGDDPTLNKIFPKNCRRVDYGIELSNEIKGNLIELNPFVKMQWTYKDYQSEALQTKMIGKYNFYNFLAAISVGNYFNVTPDEISSAISDYSPSNNRSQISKTNKNTLILDAYNANPTSMKSAIESFSLIEYPSKLAILGDMFELGNDSSQEHEFIIELVKKHKLICHFVGEHFFNFNNLANQQFCFFKTKDELTKYLEEKPIENALILLKASRGIGLEAIVEKL